MNRTRWSRKGVWLFATIAALAVTTLSVSVVRASSNKASSSGASDITKLVNSPRLGIVSVDDANSTVSVTGTASDSDADAARTFWYEVVAGAAYAQQVGAKQVDTLVTDVSGKKIDSSSDPLSPKGLDAFGPQVRSQSDLTASIDAGADSVGAKVLGIHYISLYGGTAEVVIQPADTADFVANAATKVPQVIGDLGANGNPYMLTVVDPQGTVQLVLGYSAGIGGTQGQGFAWLPKGASSDAVYGSRVDSNE